MTFTGRIRIYLVGIALIPPLAILSVVYLSLSGREEVMVRQKSSQQIELASHLKTALQEDVLSSLQALAGSRQVRLAILRPHQPEIGRAHV